jgi:chemotaxis response regulator CheB
VGSIPMRLRQGGFRVSQTIKVVVINEHRLYRECFKHILEMEMDISVVGETSHADDIYEVVGTTHPMLLYTMKIYREMIQ